MNIKIKKNIVTRLKNKFIFADFFLTDCALPANPKTNPESETKIAYKNRDSINSVSSLIFQAFG